MLGRSLRIGTVFGITLTVSWTLVLLLGVVSISMAVSSGNFALGLVTATLSLALVFSSILAHELGHSLVARRLGVRISEIELHFFGGAAKMLSLPRTPRDEILIAGAGPLVSLALAGLFKGVSLVAAPAALGGLGLLENLAYLNFLLGTFNLIPALPTDGGRILRAALSYRYGALQATRLAVKVARVATVALGLWFLVSGNYFGVALVFFLWMLGTQELRMAEVIHARGAAPFGFVEGAARSGLGGQVEVFDRNGRFLGTAPGGLSSPENESASATSPSMFPPQAGVRQHVVMRGPDGRLWVITENRYTS